MIKIIVSFLILAQTSVFAQVDTLRPIKESSMSLPRLFIVPSAFVISGLVIKETNYRESIKNYAQSSHWRTSNHVDDYIQYTPMVELFVADYVYLKSKSEVFRQTKNLIISQALTSIIIQTLKRTTNVTRPDGTPHSFPSGHTAQSFCGATGLLLEYRDINPFIAYSGYGFSTATGILRMTNNRHWISDVLVGAGIGMLTSSLVWYFEPLKNWDPFKKKNIAVYPYIKGIDGNAGLCLVF